MESGPGPPPRGRAASVAAEMPTRDKKRKTGEQSSISMYFTFESQNCK